MRLVFAGTPHVAVPALRALIDSRRHTVVAVVTRPDAPAGRGRRLVRSPVGEVADEHGIEVASPKRAGDPAFLDWLAALRPDCCPVVAYGALLPESALRVPAHGWINLHFSLLPAWRGAAPVQAAIRHGDPITGASVFQIVRELDAGPVYGVLTERVRPEDTAGELLERLGHAGARLLVDTMDGIEDGTLRPGQQPEDGVSYAPKVTVSAAHVDFTEPAIAVDRLIRSVTPDPGAWAEFRGERVKLAPVRIRWQDEPLAPGRIRVGRKTVVVGTGNRPVELTDVQAQGKKRMAATDWARGARIDEGEGLA